MMGSWMEIQKVIAIIASATIIAFKLDVSVTFWQYWTLVGTYEHTPGKVHK